MTAVLERTGLVTAAGEPLVVVREVSRARRDAAPYRSVEIEGWLTRFGSWHPITDAVEARLLGLRSDTFLETVARGALRDSFSRHASGGKQIRLMFNHGRAGSGGVGMKPLGVFTALDEDSRGPHFRARVLTGASYVDELLPAILANEFRPSYRFTVSQGTVRRNPGASEHNPEALPELTIKRAEVREDSICTFPADDAAEMRVLPASVASVAA